MTEDHIIKAVQSPPTACIAVQVRNQNEKSPWKTAFPKGLLVVLLTRPGLEPTSKNIGSDGHSAGGGNTGGNKEPDSDRYIRFCEQLRAAGFTSEQLRTIAAAFTDNGLRVVASEPGCD
jgi:hypothetical protein